jgi:hypothetical protein
MGQSSIHHLSRKVAEGSYISDKHDKAASSGGMLPVKFFPERFLFKVKVVSTNYI